jgi:hypothetical protein
MQRNALLVSRINHPNLVKFWGVFQSLVPSAMYFVQEDLDARSLSEGIEMKCALESDLLGWCKKHPESVDTLVRSSLQ